QPLEEAYALSSLIYEGVMDQFPKLKIMVAHGGGYLPFYAGRHDNEYRCGRSPHLKGDFSSYLPRFFYDTVLFNPDMLEFLVTKIPSSHVMLASDNPFAEKRPVEYVRRAKKIGKKEQDAILGANAARLVGISISSRSHQCVGTRHLPAGRNPSSHGSAAREAQPRHFPRRRYKDNGRWLTLRSFCIRFRRRRASRTSSYSVRTGTSGSAKTGHPRSVEWIPAMGASSNSIRPRRTAGRSGLPRPPMERCGSARTPATGSDGSPRQARSPNSPFRRSAPGRTASSRVRTEMCGSPKPRS